MPTEEEISKMDKDATVCFLSADIQFLLKDLKKKAVSEEDKKEISTISKKVRLIQHKAQKMEKRLKKYRDSIEKLGFIRDN